MLAADRNVHQRPSYADSGTLSGSLDSNATSASRTIIAAR